MEKNHYICIPAIDIAYQQAYLKERKYKLKKRKLVSFIDFEIIHDDDSDEEVIDFEIIDDDDNENNF